MFFLAARLALTGMCRSWVGVVAEATPARPGSHARLHMAIPLLIPSTLPYTLPATTLFATCVVYGRQTGDDNEIPASLKAAGVHLWHVIWPAVFLGLAASGITIFLSLDLIPSTHHELRTRFVSNVKEALYNTLKREGCIRHSKIDYAIYVQRVQGDKLLEALFLRREPSPKDQHYDVIAWAREAELDVDLKQNQLLVTMRNYYVITDNGVDGATEYERVFRMKLPPDLSDAATKSSARAMTWREIRDKIDKLDRDKQNKANESAAHQAEVNIDAAPTHFEDHIKNRLNQLRHIDTELRFLVTELHMRPALALGCLCFVLVGCPVGIWFSRSDYLSAFITYFFADRDYSVTR